MRFSRTLLLILTALVCAGLVFAGGAAEESPSMDEDTHGEEHSHAEDHAEDHAGELEIPEIAAIDLSGRSLRVVATTSIMGDVLAEVLGDRAELTVLIPNGQNPHSYAATPQALRTVAQVDLVFVNGLNLEENLLEDIRNATSAPIVPISAGIEPLGSGGHDHEGEDHDHEDEGEDHDHDHSAGDPHFWTDPNNVIVWVENAVTVLSQADPAGEAVYRAAADAYIAELEALDLEIRQAIAAIPRAQRKLVLDHDAYAYFADEYGLEVVGTVIPSTTDTDEPSPRDIARLAELIQDEGVSTIFVGRTASQGLASLAQAVAEEAGTNVQILPMLTGSLASPGEPGDTYLGFIRYNLGQIASGLAAN